MTKPTTQKGARSSRTTQTTRIAGQRVRLVTSNGKVTVTPAPMLEIDLQIAMVKAIKKMPEYAKTAEDVIWGKGRFTLAADQNGSGYRSRNAAVKFKAAGMAAGEPDIRFYIAGGSLKSIELKAEKGKPTESQKTRHPLLRALGFEIAVIEAATEDEAASKAVSLVRSWLAANDNRPTLAKGAIHAKM